jgi:hypothetical protein
MCELLFSNGNQNRVRSFAAFLLAMAAMVILACKSAADIRYWCLKQANRSVSASAPEPETHERLVHEMYLRCLESQGVPDAEPKPPN